jgi:inhibitor of cysteine peptidase
MSYTALCILAGLVSADTDKLVKMRDFSGEAAKDQAVRVIKDEVTVKKGDAITVRLESNPTTGFSWRVLGPEYGPLKLKSSTFAKPRAGAVGAAGTQVFEFTADKGGQQIVLVFNYGRPFEGLGTSTYELKVKVEE